MGESKYGRWRVVSAPESRFFGVHSERQGAKPGGRIAARIESRDAAYLIAAAPLMLETLRGLIFPEAPSADDLMLLFLAAGVTSAQQEAFRPFVEKYRAAQAKARAAIKAATGGEP